MIVIGSFEAIVMNSRFLEFQNKDKTKTYQVNEIGFYCPGLNITGTLRDWELTIPAEQIKSGDQIIVNYQTCQRQKGNPSGFDFNGFPRLK